MVIVNIILIILAILASVLGILLSLLLLFLVIPIRYKGKISKNEEVDSDVSIGWLFSILYGKLGYHNEKLSIVLCIFGFPIWNNRKKKPKKIKEKKRESVPELPSDEENKEPHHKEPEKPMLKESHADKIEEEHSEEDRKNNRFQNFLHGLAEKWRRFVTGVRSIPRSMKLLFHNLELVVEFLKLEINREGFRSIFHTVKKLVNHLKPGKWKLSLHFGFDDPSITGQILGGVALIYPKFGNQLMIIPDFENQILEGQFECKGRIRTGTLIFYSILLLTKPEFRQLLKNFKILKEEL